MTDNAITIHGGYYPALTKEVGQKFKYSKERKGIRTTGITPDAYRGLSETDTKWFKSYTLTKMGFHTMDIPEYYLGAQVPIAEGVHLGHVRALRKAMGEGGFDVFRKTRLTDVQKLKPQLEKFHGKANKFMLRGNYIWYSARETTGEAMASLLNSNEYSNFNFTEEERRYNTYVDSVKGKDVQGWAKKMFPNSFKGKVKISEDVIKQKAKDAAEEMLMGPQVDPGKAMGTARRADIETVINGKKVVLESTERGGFANHHELPKENTSGIEYGEYDKINDTNRADMQEKFGEYMSGTVLKDLNQYIKAIKNRRTRKQKKAGQIPVAGVKGSRGSSTSELRRDAAMNAKSAAQRQATKKMTRDQALWVNHTLSNIAANAGKEYRSGIPITEASPQTGERWYGSTRVEHYPVSAGTKAFEYNLDVAKAQAKVFSGLSHYHALLKDRDKAAAAKEAINHKIKHQTFGMHQVHRSRDANIVHNIVSSAGIYSSINAASKPLTVSFSPKIAKKLINECLDVIHEDLQKSLIEEGRNSRADILKAERKSFDSGIFWALPYISIEEQLYRG
jgi:hypothetical protein